MIESNSLFLFPKQLVSCYDDNYVKYREDIIKLCHSEREKDPVGASFSNRSGWQSKEILNADGTYWETFFNELISNMLSSACRNELGLKPNSRIELIRWWANISQKGSYNLIHTHPMCHYSGIFYVKCSENSAPVAFFQKVPDFLTNSAREESFLMENNMYQSYYFQPKEGTLLLFPSSLDHCVEMQEYDEERISISFDINIWP